MMADFYDYSGGTPQLTDGMLDQDMVADDKRSERLGVLVVMSYLPLLGSPRSFFKYVSCFLPFRSE
jgi:hypothetical protein